MWHLTLIGALGKPRDVHVPRVLWLGDKRWVAVRSQSQGLEWRGLTVGVPRPAWRRGVAVQAVLKLRTLVTVRTWCGTSGDAAWLFDTWAGGAE